MGAWPNPPWRSVELLERGLDDRVDNAGVEIAASAMENFGFGDRFFERLCRTIHFRAARLERFGNRKQHALEAGAAHRIVGGK